MWTIVEFRYFMITTTIRSTDNIDSRFIGTLDISFVENLRISRLLRELFVRGIVDRQIEQ
jgi:hypothetical protein